MKTAAKLLGLFLCVAPLVAISADYTVVFGNTTTGAGTMNLGNPHTSVYTVTSKFNQPRNVNGTNPHRGTDLGSPYGTLVLAPWNGWATTVDPGAYELVIYLDLNNDNLKNDNAHMKFDHLSSILVTAGAKITKGQSIAKVGDEGGYYSPHLHFGMMKDLATDGYPDVWIRNEPYYRNVAAWDNGKMLDFISFSTFNANTAAVYCYSHDETGKQTVAQGDVIIYHRKTGTSTWTAATATKSGDKFSFNLGTKYSRGTSVQWMVRANRTSIKGQTSYYWAYHPPKFNQPSADPNSTTYTYDYFTNTIL